MKHFVHFCIFLIIACFFTACVGDKDNEQVVPEKSSDPGDYNETVIIHDDGRTSNGSVYSPIDLNSFYLDGVKYVIDNSHIIVSDYNKEISLGDIKIPFAIKIWGTRYEVSKIESNAFYNCTSLTSITIPNSLTSIGREAFWGCSNLTSINIPNSVTSIEICTFQLCSRLTSINIPNSVISIGSGAFGGCYELTSITIPNSVTSVGEWAFSSTTWYDNQPDGLVYAGKNVYTYKGTMPENTSIIINEGTLGIAEGAFSGCFRLTSITIPNSVTNIGKYAFSYCSNLTSISIPNSMTSIGDGAFNRCSNLTSISIPNSVTSIGREAFNDCSGLTSIIVEGGNPNYDSRNNCNAIISTANNTLIYGCKNTMIPNSVTSIGDFAFKGCSNLTSISIPNSVSSIGFSAFSDCTGLTSISIPNSVTSIGDYAFLYCSGLTSITIPNSVTSIGNSAFSDCTGLTSIIIGNGMTSIGAHALYECSSLTDVYCYAEQPPTINYYSFFDKATLHVPANSISEYQNASYWKRFKDIVALTDNDPKP